MTQMSNFLNVIRIRKRHVEAQLVLLLSESEDALCARLRDSFTKKPTGPSAFE